MRVFVRKHVGSVAGRRVCAAFLFSGMERDTVATNFLIMPNGEVRGIWHVDEEKSPSR